MNAKELRKAYREFTFSNGSKPAYHKDIYKERIVAHFGTIEKYLSQFGKIYQLEKGRKYRKDRPTINDIYRLFRRNRKNLFNEFSFYLKGKTHFSYDVHYQPQPMKIQQKWSSEKWKQKWEERDLKTAYKGKVAEFIILILSEYIILHNYMWASGLKMRQINSIDDWMENIN